MSDLKDPDLYYPQFGDDVPPAVAESIRLLFDNVYMAVGKKGNATVHDSLRVKKDLDLNTRGAQLKIRECDGCVAGQTSDASMGVATLVSGTAVVKCSLIRDQTRVMLTPQNDSPSGPAVNGNLWVSARETGVSFTISSSNGGDDRDVAWLLIQPSGLNQ